MERIEFKNDKNQNIVGVLDRVNDGCEVVIVIHGYPSNKDGGARILSAVLSQNGINSFRVDLDNRGESEPKLEESTITSYKNTILSAIQVLISKGFSVIDIVGTSFGGAVALAVACEYPLNKIALRSPVVDHYQRMLKRYGISRLKQAKEAGYIDNDKGNSNRAVYRMDYDWIEDAKNYQLEKTKDINTPILLIQGTDDESVDPQVNIAAVKQFRNAKLELIDGANHWLGVNGDFSKSQKALVDFFKQ